MGTGFANFVAVFDEDPRELLRVEQALRAASFQAVLRISGWVAAIAPMPGVRLEAAVDRDALCAQGELRELIALSAGLPLRDLEAYSVLARRATGEVCAVSLREAGEAYLIRPATGHVPLYVRREVRRTIIATRLEYCIRASTAPVELDPLPNACWAAGELVFPYGRTFLRDTSIVPPGHVARLSRSGMRWSRYWVPQTELVQRPDSRRVLENTIALRECLLERLHRDLSDSDTNLLLLSGGVDSSALAVLACGVVRKPVSTLTFLPPAEHPLHSREDGFVRDLERTLDFRRSWHFPFSRDLYQGYLARRADVAFYVLHPALGVVADLAREVDIKTVFGGEFADETCGSALVFTDWIDATSMLDLARGAGRWPNGSRDGVRWLKHRTLSLARRPMVPHRAALPAPATPSVQAEYLDWLADRRRQFASDCRPHRALSAYLGVDGWSVMNWEALSPLGIRRSLPFFNRAVLELAFRCHPDEQFGEGPKTLLRRALRRDVPARYLDRPDKGRWGHRSPLPIAVPRMAEPELATIVQIRWLANPPRLADFSEVNFLRNLERFCVSVRGVRGF